MEPKEEIKQRLPIEVVIGEYVELKRSGRNYKGLSPFSSEKTPSFIVSPEKNIWHDFSSSKGGDIFSFIMEVEGLEFPAALKHLAQKAGIELEEFSPTAKKDAALKQKIYQINKLATKYFQACLIKNPAALDYLKNRAISKQAIKDFQLGYAPNSPQGLVNLLRKNGFKDPDILKAGIASQRGGQLYDIFRERLMFPFISIDGHHLGFTGRLTKTDGFGPKYLNTPQTLVYNKSAFLYGMNLAKEPIRKNNQAILLEGNMDVVISSQAGIKEVIAASGTAITALQLRQIQRFTENLILCLDTDKAGIEATFRSLELLAKTELKVTVITIPEPFKDPDELIKSGKSNEGADKWLMAVQGASDAYIWLIETLAKGIDLTSPTDKGSYARKATQIINQIQNPVSKEAYQKYLADKLDVSIEALDQLAQSAPVKRLRPIKTDTAQKVDKNAHKLQAQIDFYLALLTELKDSESITDYKEQIPPEWIPYELPKNYYQSLPIDDKTKLSLEQASYKDTLGLIYDDFKERSSGSSRFK
jgi:DNA primase